MEIIDLTHTIKEGMPKFDAPWHISPKITKMGEIGSVGRETRSLVLGTHSGTHIDAPKHFLEGGASIEEIPLSTLVGPVSIIDFSMLPENGAVSVPMLKEIKITERMIFRFGWEKHWSDGEFYKNYPFFSREAALYLISKRVKLVGVDTPSPDDSRGKMGAGEDDSPVHKLFLTGGVTLVEYIANLGAIQDYAGWNLIALPLKIGGADGSPARVCIYR